MRNSLKKCLENGLVNREILIVYKHDEPLYLGRTGIITHIDDNGHLHGTWGNNSINMIIDLIKIIG